MLEEFQGDPQLAPMMLRHACLQSVKYGSQLIIFKKFIRLSIPLIFSQYAVLNESFIEAETLISNIPLWQWQYFTLY